MTMQSIRRPTLVATAVATVLMLSSCGFNGWGTADIKSTASEPAPAPESAPAPTPEAAPELVPEPAPEPVLEPDPEPAPAAAPPVSASYTNCAAVKAAGAAPIHAGEPGYSTKLDRDGDGVACEN